MPNVCKTVNRWFFETIVEAGCAVWSFACIVTASVFNNETVTNNSEIMTIPDNGTSMLFDNGTSTDTHDVDIAIEVFIPIAILISLLCCLLYAKRLQDYDQNAVTSHNIFCCFCDLVTHQSKCCRPEEAERLRPHVILPRDDNGDYNALGEMQQPVADDDKGSFSP